MRTDFTTFMSTQNDSEIKCQQRTWGSALAEELHNISGIPMDDEVALKRMDRLLKMRDRETAGRATHA